MLAERYKMTDLGPCKDYLGTEVHRDLMKRTLTINQRTKIEKLLKEHGMEQYAYASTPMDARIDLEKSDTSYVPDQEEHSVYRSLRGLLDHLMVYTRPDIAYACLKLAQYNSRPNNIHWKALKRVLRYLAGTLDKGITYGLGRDKEIAPKQLIGWTDLAYADDVDNSHSISGYVFLLNGGPISWNSTKEKIIATSICQAEYMAQCSATMEAEWLRGLLSELRFLIPGTNYAIRRQPRCHCISQGPQIPQED